MSYVRGIRPDLPRELTAPSLESQMIRRRRGHSLGLGSYVVSSWSRGVGAIGAIDLGHGKTSTPMTRPQPTSTTSKTTSTVTRYPIQMAPKPLYKPPTTTTKSPVTVQVHQVTPAQQIELTPQQKVALPAGTPLPPSTSRPKIDPGSSGGSTSTSSGGGGGGTPAPPASDPGASYPSDEIEADTPADEITVDDTAAAKPPMSKAAKVGLLAGAGLVLFSMFSK